MPSSVETVRRISPEEVVAAYRKTGMRVLRGDYWDGMSSCCAATAVLFAERDELMTDADDFEAALGCLCGRSEAAETYLSGFICGFDGGAICGSLYGQLGYYDGRAAWDAVVAAGLVAEDGNGH